MFPPAGGSMRPGSIPKPRALPRVPPPSRHANPDPSLGTAVARPPFPVATCRREENPQAPAQPTFPPRPPPRALAWRQCTMQKPEIRMKPEARNPNSDIRPSDLIRHSGFRFLNSLVFNLRFVTFVALLLRGEIDKRMLGWPAASPLTYPPLIHRMLHAFVQKHATRFY